MTISSISVNPASASPSRRRRVARRATRQDAGCGDLVAVRISVGDLSDAHNVAVRHELRDGAPAATMTRTGCKVLVSLYSPSRQSHSNERAAADSSTWENCSSLFCNWDSSPRNRWMSRCQLSARRAKVRTSQQGQSTELFMRCESARARRDLSDRRLEIGSLLFRCVCAQRKEWRRSYSTVMAHAVMARCTSHK